jgi:colanic acid/amylovoran biosynthesis glycosyltransferase
MKIAFLVRHFPALSETFVLNQITGLIDRGHEVDILAESPRREALVHPDVERYGLVKRTAYWPARPRSRPTRWLKGLVLLARTGASRPRAAAVAANVAAYGRLALTMNLGYAATPIRAGRRYDIVHCHFGDNGILGMALRDMGLLEGKLITSFYGFDLSLALKKSPRLYSRLVVHGDLFLPVSERFHQRLLELGCASTKVTVHRMGIDCRRFAFRSRQPRPDGVLRLVSVARLVEKKGIEYAIRAVAELKTTGRRIVYTIVGDGPLAQHLARLVADLRVGDVVHWLGTRAQPDVIRILDDAHVLVAPSVVAGNGDEEGTPAILMEAMAMGLPVIATRHSGIPEVVEDGVSGILVPERDAGALARGIVAIADRPDRWLPFGRAGRARILAQHDIESLNDSLVNVYQGLLDRKVGDVATSSRQQ